MCSAYPAGFALLLSCIASASVHAQETPQQEPPREGEVMLTDDSVQLTYMTNSEGIGVDNGSVRFGGFLNEQRDIVGSAALLVEATRLRYGRLDIHFGTQGFAALLGDENQDIFSIAVGGEARFELLRRSDVDFIARGWYAPDILTFGNGDRLYDVSAHIELPLTGRVVGMAGYRYFKADGTLNDTVLENSVFLGFRRDL